MAPFTRPPDRPIRSTEVEEVDMKIPSEALAAADPHRPQIEPWASLHEERRDLLECVREAMAANSAGAGRAAACAYLLNHLFDTSPSVH
jgi:hypothetical protein